jgi:ABC-2 type transport system permease protein
MSLRRVGILLGKEFFTGPKNFIFIFALVAPIILSLVVMLIFGTLFADEATLGFVDEGDSQLTTLIEESSSVESRVYDNVSQLKGAVADGAVDGGIVIPPDFDNSLLSGERVDLPIYIWGESLSKNRSIITVTVTNLIRDLSSQEAPVVIDFVTIGDQESIPWDDRLLPLVVLIAVVMAGVMLPGTSVLLEKEKKTIDALVATPATIIEVFLSKGLLGVVIGVVMGVVILLMNQAFGSHSGLLIMMLFLGAVMAAGIGLLISSFARDTTSFFATMKMFGILLYAPAFFYMFPDLPQWIGKIFPTYYIVEPVLEISQRGGGWPEIATNVFILIGLNIVIIALVGFTISRKRQYAV